MPASSFLSHCERWPGPGDTLPPSKATDTVLGSHRRYLSPTTQLSFQHSHPKDPTGEETNPRSRRGFQPDFELQPLTGEASPSSTVTSHLAPSTAQGGQEPPLDRSAAPAEPGEVGITPSRSRPASSSTPTFAFATDGDPNSYLIPKTEGFCSGLLTTKKRLLPRRTALVVFDVAVAFD